ncbi:hypothetical protein BV25DRAFT_1830686 [Artomyces pyxidatus]|uniref:Uncharacterized protein n=1 Tax=Artomyces pyxidatus TaxID=48021 RepID=A0ACB8SMH5_9AGAM|nr:hypothetical protein BV25DRAFT_1830686 [Artomyces pyxidatus]
MYSAGRSKLIRVYVVSESPRRACHGEKICQSNFHVQVGENSHLLPLHGCAVCNSAEWASDRQDLLPARIFQPELQECCAFRLYPRAISVAQLVASAASVDNRSNELTSLNALALPHSCERSTFCILYYTYI